MVRVSLSCKFAFMEKENMTEEKTVTLADWSWKSVITLVWDLIRDVETQLGQAPDLRTIELIYSPAVAELLIRKQGVAMRKITPTVDEIGRAYQACGGEAAQADDLLGMVSMADRLAARAAEVNGDDLVALSKQRSNRAAAIYTLASTLDPAARQEFQRSFLWNEERRSSVFNDDELGAWRSLELQAGVGILASIGHSKQQYPELSATEMAMAILRKYGIPIVCEGNEIYACHYCSAAPCVCGGGKSPKRCVTYEDAEQELHRGPWDTQMAMYYAYAWGNSFRAGEAYGPFRAVIEMIAEKGAVLADRDGKPRSLSGAYGPFLLPTQHHWAEVIDRCGRDVACVGREVVVIVMSPVSARHCTISLIISVIRSSCRYIRGSLLILAHSPERREFFTSSSVWTAFLFVLKKSLDGCIEGSCRVDEGGILTGSDVDAVFST